MVSRTKILGFSLWARLLWWDFFMLSRQRREQHQGGWCTPALTSLATQHGPHHYGFFTPSTWHFREIKARLFLAVSTSRLFDRFSNLTHFSGRQWLDKMHRSFAFLCGLTLDRSFWTHRVVLFVILKRALGDNSLFAILLLHYFYSLPIQDFSPFLVHYFYFVCSLFPFFSCIFLFLCFLFFNIWQK